MEKMNSFVKTSNLPNDTSCVIIGKKYEKKLHKSLADMGIEMIAMPDNPFVDTRLSSHADLSVCHAGGDLIFLAPHLKNSFLFNILLEKHSKIRILDIIQRSLYPHDAQMNICLAGKNYIYSRRYSSVEIIKSLKKQGMVGIDCRQAYAKCSVCVVDNNSIISSDKGIVKKCREAGMSVLEIEQGHIALPGFDYGFIGGSGFKISNKILAFTGSLEHHPNKLEIKSFLYERDIQPVFLTNEPIFDIGSAICLTEK